MKPGVVSLKLCGLLVLLPSLAHAIDVQQILAEADRVTHPTNLQGRFTMTLVSPRGEERVTEVAAYQKRVSDTREDRLFLFTHPPSVKGTGLLVNSYLDQEEDRMWIYLPAVGRLKRVNLSTSGGGYFMGSDFTYSDLISTARDEFFYELTGEATVDGAECYVLDQRGKTRTLQRKYGYSREVQFVRKSDYVTVRAVFYDLAGDVLKELRVEQVKEIGPYRYPSRVVMENKQTGHRSEIRFSDIDVPETIPDEYFTARYLQNQ